jgi:hypothetical protein
MLRRTIPAIRNRLGLGVRFLPGLLLLGSPWWVQAQTTVYRCTNEVGQVEFRQTPCSARAGQKELLIHDRRTGWVPPSPPEQPASPVKRSRKKVDKAAQATRERRQAERCWKKRRQLDDVNWQLRRGYKAGAGVKLRRRRDDYEAYISRFCTD